MIEVNTLRLGLGILNFGLKFFPFKIMYRKYLDRNRLAGISFQRINIGEYVSPPSNENEYTVIFKNQVIRTSQKISRKRVKGGTKAKIRKPQTDEEKALIDFHKNDEYRSNYLGSFFIKNEAGNNERRVTDRLDVEIQKRLSVSSTGTLNRVFYLQGSIGCGKSTLLSTITSQIGRGIFDEINKGRKKIP